MDEEKQNELRALAEPLIKFLCENGHPHMQIIIGYDSAELVEGVCAFRCDAFIPDYRPTGAEHG